MFTPEEIFAGIGTDDDLFDISIMVATAGEPSQSFSQRLNDSELNAILGSLMRVATGMTNMNYSIPSDEIHWMFTLDNPAKSRFIDIFVHATRV